MRISEMTIERREPHERGWLFWDVLRTTQKQASPYDEDMTRKESHYGTFAEQKGHDDTVAR